MGGVHSGTGISPIHADAGEERWGEAAASHGPSEVSVGGTPEEVETTEIGVGAAPGAVWGSGEGMGMREKRQREAWIKISTAPGRRRAYSGSPATGNPRLPKMRFT